MSNTLNVCVLLFQDSWKQSLSMAGRNVRH